MRKIKLNPLILGDGTKIFGGSTSAYKLALTDSDVYENGLQIMTYEVLYGNA
ncbi:MAG: hypothetical protein H6575_11650 [Lewinellaceae bacterium]|nr:hypothetical protein [Lewinellaceae bacterium]